MVRIQAPSTAVEPPSVAAPPPGEAEGAATPIPLDQVKSDIAVGGVDVPQSDEAARLLHSQLRAAFGGRPAVASPVASRRCNGLVAFVCVGIMAAFLMYQND